MSTEEHPELPAWAVDMLRCPVTGAPLHPQDGPHGEPELVSSAEQHRIAYPVRAGVPVLLADQGRRLG
ncbi:MAG TPA: hypothetical protein VK086_08530 [Ruania sp.]|nr:hypothetical protein [Ruania sp.]